MNDLYKKTLERYWSKKMGKYDNEHNRLFNACKMSIIMLECIWKDIKTQNLEDSQWVLDWLDKINEISIRN